MAQESGPVDSQPQAPALAGATEDYLFTGCARGWNIVVPDSIRRFELIRMITEQQETYDWLFGAILSALIFGGFLLIRHYRFAPEVQPSDVVSTSALPAPVAERDRVAQSPMPAADDQQARATTRIFECEIGGARVLSDQPCGTNARVREVRAPNLMDAHRAPQNEPPRYQASPSFRNSASERAEDSGVCGALEAQIDQINARMRQRYTSREGEWLRDRLRSLKNAQHEAECRFLRNRQ